MKMKKLISTILLATTALSLAACSSGKGAANKAVTISVQVEKDWMPYYEQVKERVVSKYPKATINFIESGSFDHLGVIDKTDATNKDVADVFALPADRLTEMANKNVLAPLDAEKMAENVGGFKDFKGGLGGNLKVGEDYFAFPYNIETLIAYVNVANAKAKGIDTTKSIEFTTLGFESMLSVVHDAWFGVSFANSANLELLGKDKDGKFYSDTTKKFSELTQDQQKLFESLYKYWSEHKEKKTNLWDKDAAFGYLDEKFKTGNGNAIRIDGPWATGGVTKLVGSADNLEVLPLNSITVNGKQLSQWKGGWGLAVNARVEKDEAQMEVAKAFIEEVVNPKHAKDLFKATGKILENVEPSAYEGIDAMDKKVIDATYKSYATAESRPLFTEWGNVWATWQNSLLSWSSTNPKNAEEAYNQVKAGFDAMMANMKK